MEYLQDYDQSLDQLMPKVGDIHDFLVHVYFMLYMRSHDEKLLQIPFEIFQGLSRI